MNIDARMALREEKGQKALDAWNKTFMMSGSVT
jgi:hypothetical protein